MKYLPPKSSLWHHIKERSRDKAEVSPGFLSKLHLFFRIAWVCQAARLWNHLTASPPCVFGRKDHKNAAIIFTKVCMFTVISTCLCLPTHLLSISQLFYKDEWGIENEKEGELKRGGFDCSALERNQPRSVKLFLVRKAVSRDQRWYKHIKLAKESVNLWQRLIDFLETLHSLEKISRDHLVLPLQQSCAD